MEKQADKYSFNNREVLASMVRFAGLKKGRWMLAIQFDFKGGNIGSDQDDIAPGSVTLIRGLQLVRADDDAPESLVIDAANMESD